MQAQAADARARSALTNADAFACSNSSLLIGKWKQNRFMSLMNIKCELCECHVADQRF